jgi:hypothetical protein
MLHEEQGEVAARTVVRRAAVIRFGEVQVVAPLIME